MLDGFLTESKLDAAYEREHIIIPANCGGFASFEGVIRNHNHGKKVSHIDYEAYDALAAKEMSRIVEEAKERWPIELIHVKHRVGTLNIGDTAVVIFVSSPHRREAFLACEYLIDELKKRVPIWKHEHYTDGSRDWSYCREHDHHHGAVR